MKQCRDPRHNRIAGCIMTAGGLLLMMWGSRYPTAEDPYNGKNWFLIVLSAAVLIWSVIWMVKTVRCPPLPSDSEPEDFQYRYLSRLRESGGSGLSGR